MQLRSSIFAWTSLSLLLPLIALVLGATLYGQRLYQERVDRDVFAVLNTISGEIDRRLRFEREMLFSLHEATVVQQFMPVMEQASKGQMHPEFFERLDVVNDFLEEFQKIVASFNTLRILDANGNTLSKVRGGKRFANIFDGIESFPYAEEEIFGSDMLKRLMDLPTNQVGVTLLTQSLWEQRPGDVLPMMDYIIPIAPDNHVIGYLSANIIGEQIDRILDLASRPNRSKLFIAEYNPGQPRRNGLLIYDDEQELRFADIKLGKQRITDQLDEDQWKDVSLSSQSHILLNKGNTALYTVEYSPYPNLLATWIIGMRVDTREIAAPFERMRLFIILFSIAAVLVSLFIARLSASRIARPVSRLAQSLRDYARGNFNVRVTPEGSDELRALGEVFNSTADTLDHARLERDHVQALLLQQAKLASIGELAAGIGHELNNPLGNILSYAKLIERQVPGDDNRLRSDITALRDEAMRASRIIKGILDFARQVPAHFETFELCPWLVETVALVKQVAHDKSVDITTDDCFAGQVNGDRGQLQQALINLLLNAIHASSPGQLVEVAAEESAEGVVITVRDHGAGIPGDVMDKIFDPFFTTKAVGQGSGLGLSIALGIVSQHGGDLAIMNHPDGGVLVTLILKAGIDRV